MTEPPERAFGWLYITFFIGNIRGKNLRISWQLRVESKYLVKLFSLHFVFNLLIFDLFALHIV